MWKIWLKALVGFISNAIAILTVHVNKNNETSRYPPLSYLKRSI